MNTRLKRSIRRHLDNRKKRKNIVMSAVALSIVTVLSVYGVLLQPAISQEKKQMLLTADKVRAGYEDILTVDVTAAAKPEQEETFFLISMEENGAMLSDEYEFDEEGITVIELEDDRELELHRETDEEEQTTNYWFSLKEGEKAAFSLNCVSVFGPSRIATASDAVRKASSSNAETKDFVKAEVSLHDVTSVQAVQDQAEAKEAEADEPDEKEDTAEKDDAAEKDAAEEKEAEDDKPDAEPEEKEEEAGAAEQEEDAENAEPEENGSDAEAEEADPSDTEAERSENEPEAVEPSETEKAEASKETETVNEKETAVRETAETEAAPEKETEAEEVGAAGSSGGGTGSAAASGAGSTVKLLDPDEDEELDEAEFGDELTLKITYTSGEDLEACEEKLEDGDELTLTWLSEEVLEIEGIAELNVEVDSEDVYVGDAVPVTVTASLSEDAMESKIVSLVMNSKKAGLSDDFEFESGICEITDDNGNMILLHRQKTDKADQAVYWFPLDPGMDASFELTLVDEADLSFLEGESNEAEEEEDEDEVYMTASPSDTRSFLLWYTEQSDRKLEEEKERREAMKTASASDAQATEDTEEETTDEETDEFSDGLRIESSLELYAGVGYSRSNSRSDALKRPVATLNWLAEGEYILTAVTDDGVKVTLTAPNAAFPGTGNLELSVRELTGEEAEAAEKLIQEKAGQANQSIEGMRLWDITILNDGEEIQPQEPVHVTFTNLPETKEGAAKVVYHVDGETAQVNDMNAVSEEDGTLVIQTNHFSTYATGDVMPLDAETTTSVTVIKRWVDNGEAVTHDDVTIRLLANEVEKNTLTLNEGNAWSGSFPELPLKDDQGKEIQYTVREDSVPGYITSYTEQSAGTKEVWVPATNFSNGDEFLIVYDNNAITNSNSSNLSATSVSILNNSITVDGIEYEQYIESVTDNQKWKATTSGSDFVLQNVGTSRYLRRNNNNSKFQTDSYRSSDITYNNGHISSSGLLAKYYMNGNGTIVQNETSATNYTLYKKVTMEDESTGKNIIITNTKTIDIEIGGGGGNLEHAKTIDYLGDNESNPDTSVSGDDLYRLYLDITGQDAPMDLVIVVDRSGSMDDPVSSSDNTARDVAVERLLNGYGSQPSFIEQFLNLNEENQISIVWFASVSGKGVFTTGESGIVQDWRSTFTKVNNNSNGDTNNIGGKDGYGTDYMAGLWKAADMINDPAVATNGHAKMVLFLTDGTPTKYVVKSSNDSTVATYNDYLGWKAGNNNSLYRTGSGSSTTNDEINATKACFDEFVQYNPGVVFANIMFAGEDEYGVLAYMVRNGGGSYTADSADSLFEILQDYFIRNKATNVTITDQISKYVEWYAESPDLVITKTKVDDSTDSTIIWQAVADDGTNGIGKATYENYDKNVDMNIIQSVTYTPASSSEGGSSSTGTLQVVFNPEYALDKEYKYTVSFNVEITQTSFDEWGANKENGDSTGYNGVTGEDATDYGSNITSSKQPGFHSNASATVSYFTRDQAYSEDYKHPVIQVDGLGIAVQKVNANDMTEPLSGAKFDLYKKVSVKDDSSVQFSGLPGMENAYWNKVNSVSLETDENGTFNINSLVRNQTYCLVETSAPNGFQKLTVPIGFTVASNGTSITVTPESAMAEVIVDSDTNVITLQIKNTAGTILPSTGGSGTLPYTIAGLAILMAFGLMYRRTLKGGQRT